MSAFDPASNTPRTDLDRYAWTRADGVAVASPIFQSDGGGSTPTSALQLRFNPVGFHLARQLVALWHSRLPFLYPGAAGGGSYCDCYAAEFDDGWYAAAVWTSPIALNRMRVDYPTEVIELRRLAICDAAPANTASRMLGYMVRDLHRRHPGLYRFISYQDTDVHLGTIYRAAGWTAGDAQRFQTWNSEGRTDRTGEAVQQSTAAKVRWELRRPQWRVEPADRPAPQPSVDFDQLDMFGGAA